MKDDVKLKFITQIRLKNYSNFEEYKQNLYDSEKYYILLSIFELLLYFDKDIFNFAKELLNNKKVQ